MKKGYTLVELLVIIVIMGLLATLLVPMVTGIVERSTNKAFKEDGKAIIRSSEEIVSNYNEGECFNVKSNDLEINLSNDIKGGQVCIINSKPYLKHIRNDDKCISGNDDELEVYDCNKKVVVFFDGTSLGNKNVPIKFVGYKAFIIEKNKKLDLSSYYLEYLDLDSNTLFNTYNFYDNYKLQYVPKKWVNESNNSEYTSSTTITEDTKFVINEFSRINEVNNIDELQSGNYKIKMSSDTSKSIGYDNYIVYNKHNRVIIKNNSMWTVNKYVDHYFILPSDNNELSWDVPGGIPYQDLELSIWPLNWSDQQKFIIVSTGVRNNYMIKAYSNNSLCIEANELTDNAHLLYQTCDPSNPRQIFKFIKQN